MTGLRRPSDDATGCCCKGRRIDFRSTDPVGYTAGQAFADAPGAGGSLYRDHTRQAAELAHRSDTGSLANLALPNYGATPVIKDLGDFRDA